MKVFLSLCFFFATVKALEPPENDLAKNLFSRPIDSITKCHQASSQCGKCFSVCPKYRSYFANTYASINVPSQLFECRVNMSHHRIGMPSWCMNDAKGFYPTDDFKASEHSCIMDPPKCSNRMMKMYKEKYRLRLMSNRNVEYKLVQKLEYAGRLFEQVRDKEEWYEGVQDKYKRLKKWFEEGVLREMREHLRNPKENITRFADPVYTMLNETEDKIKELSDLVSETDVNEGLLKLTNARSRAGKTIERYVGNIGRFENHIISKKAETDKYLREIKNLVSQMSQTQQRTVDFAFERTHVSSLDGELGSLNKGLLRNIKKLRKERLLFTEEMKQTAVEKFRLVRGVREMIRSVSLAQRRKCKSEDMINA